MGCSPSRSSTSSPEPENNNSDVIKRKSGLDPSLIPDPTCGVDIRLSPTISQVDEEGSGRPARVEVKDQCTVKPKTGEEPRHEQAHEEAPGNGQLGILSTDMVAVVLQGLGADSLFEDPDFPADSDALFYTNRTPEELAHFSWKR